MANKFTGTISILIYLTTLILGIIEITKAKLLYDATCSAWSCWAIFIVVWALSIPAAFFSLVREVVSLSLGSRQRKLNITTAVLVFAFWLVVLIIGWAPIHFPRTVTADDFGYSSSGYGGDDIDYDGPAPDVTGMFRYVKALYELVIPYYSGSQSGNDVFVLAQAGYGAAIMSTVSLWKVYSNKANNKQGLSRN